MQTSIRKMICGRFVLFAISTAAILVIAGMLIAQSAHAQDSPQFSEEAQEFTQEIGKQETYSYINQNGETVTHLVARGTDTGIELVGNRQATTSDYDFGEDGTCGIVGIICTDLAVQGTGINNYLRVDMHGSTSIHVRNLDITYFGMDDYIPSSSYNVNITIEDGCTLKTSQITNFTVSYSHNATFSGSGKIQIDNGFIFWRNGDLIFDGPEVFVTDNLTSFEAPAIGTFETGDIVCKSGRIIIHSELGGIDTGYTEGGVVKIEEACEVFCSVGLLAGIGSQSEDAFCSGQIYGLENAVPYEEKDKVVNQVTWQYDSEYSRYMYSVNGKLAHTIYHPGLKKLESFELATTPTKTEYLVGEAFDKTGLTVTKTYSDGTSETYTPEDAEISGFDSSTPGEKTVTVTCNAEEANEVLTTSFTVTVKAASEEPGVSPASGSTQTGDSNALAILCVLVALVAASSVVLRRSRN